MSLIGVSTSHYDNHKDDYHSRVICLEKLSNIKCLKFTKTFENIASKVGQDAIQNWHSILQNDLHMHCLSLHSSKNTVSKWEKIQIIMV